jgi:alpha-2-macroglobulin
MPHHHIPGTICQGSMFTRALVFSILIFSVSVLSCSRRGAPGELPEPAFHPMISAFTSGAVSSLSFIRVLLSENSPLFTEPMSEADPELFRFSPSIPGKAYWIDSRTIEFRPEKKLENGKSFNARFRVSKIFTLPSDQANFDFSFRTIPMDIMVKTGPFTSSGPDGFTRNQLKGEIISSDIIDPEIAEAIVSASQNGKPLPVRWTGSRGRVHSFTVDSIMRRETSQAIELAWSGKAAGAPSVSGKITRELLPSGEFTLIDVTVTEEPRQMIIASFSEPLDETFNLRGLIRLDSPAYLRFIIEGNQVKIYPDRILQGNIDFYAEPGIRNARGQRLESRHMSVLSLESLKPAVRLTGRGIILPSSGGLLFPFETVNLSAVELRIIRIFEDNVTQFLQVNSLDGERELRRAGRLVFEQTIPLTSGKAFDPAAWTNWSVSLDDYIDIDPGSIYRVEIGFWKEHSLYPCGDTGTGSENIAETSGNSGTSWNAPSRGSVPDPEEIAYWDNTEGNMWDDYQYRNHYLSYEWNERDNPCHDAYYGRRRFVSRNVLASDLGLTVKSGNDGLYHIAVADLVSAAPVPGVELEFMNFQKKVLGTAVTGNDGRVSTGIDGRPFMVTARKGNQRGYLRLDDGSSLSVSRFDTGGDPVQEGIRGFIYGERGVWRPGDSIFLTFILDDIRKVLPANHPVVMELINPRRQVEERIVRTRGENGFYKFATATDREAPTGSWSAVIKVGSATFTRNIRVETIRPNRMRMELEMGSGLPYLVRGDVRGKLGVQWLHGAPAGMSRAHISVTLSRAETKFDNYNNFVFDDPAKEFAAEEHTVFEGRTDSRGEAVFSTTLTTKNAAPGMLNASFITRAFESGGGFSIDRFSMPYSAYEYYAGLGFPADQDNGGIHTTGTDHKFEVVTVDPSGKPVDREKIRVEIYRLRWRWWWESGTENLASYAASPSHKPVFSRELTTRGGKAGFSFRVEDNDWGRYLVRVTDVAGGHSSGRIIFFDWPGWQSRAMRENPEYATMLSFSTDKQKYEPGEEVLVNFPSTAGGRALVSIENSWGIIRQWWVDCTEGETSFRFKAAKEMTPNVYIGISLLQPHERTDNDLPVRLYGVIPLFVEDPASRLEPVMKLPAELRPGEKAKIEVNEKEGRKMTYTIALVDEGLLDLTRFRTPDPWRAFYARQALGVKTWDMYDFVAGAWGGRLEGMFSIGGDEEITGSNPANVNRFEPMVRFLGPFTLERRRTASHIIEIPRYTGSVRAMLIAGNEGAWGTAEQRVPVRKPLMVLTSLPRKLSPGESLRLPVIVFSTSAAATTVSVTLATNEMLTISGAATQQVTFQSPGEKLVWFDIEVATGTGAGKLKVTASGSGETAVHDAAVEIFNPNPPVTVVTDFIIGPGETRTLSYAPAGERTTNRGIIEISSLPPFNLSENLGRLMSEPHHSSGHITSSAFPLLYLPSLMQMTEDETAMSEQHIRETIRRVASFQLPSGGISWWPGSGFADAWITSWSGHFMIEAGAAGYQIPAGFMDNWTRFQRGVARNWMEQREGSEHAALSHEELAQAYRLYTLALAGQPEAGAMNRLRESPSLSVQARWRLGAAYVLAGQPEAAERLTSAIPTQTRDYSPFNLTYGSADRDQAMILETLMLMGRRQEAVPVAMRIARKMSSGTWMNNQARAWSLRAVSLFLQGEKASDEMKFDLQLNNRENLSVTAPALVRRFDLPSPDREGTVVITNRGTASIYGLTSVTGTPGPGQMGPAERYLKIETRYLTMEGEPLDISRIAQGTDFLAEVTVTNPAISGDLRQVALTRVFPSGWEIHNTSMDLSERAFAADVPSYMDTRDDRVYQYFDLPAGRRARYVVQLNASYTGRFYLPGAYAAPIDDETIHARGSGRWVEVYMPGTP